MGLSPGSEENESWVLQNALIKHDVDVMVEMKTAQHEAFGHILIG
jgi:hypothetical protein